MRVLIVDDDPQIRALLRHTLDGALIREAADGHEALAALHADHDIDAVLLDVMLPGMSGFDVLAAIRGDRSLRDLPIIMLTARTADADHLLGYRRGADAYVTKPFDIDELLGILDRVLMTPREERVRVRQDETAQAELLVRIETSFSR